MEAEHGSTQKQQGAWGRDDRYALFKVVMTLSLWSLLDCWNNDNDGVNFFLDIKNDFLYKAVPHSPTINAKKKSRKVRPPSGKFGFSHGVQNYVASTYTNRKNRFRSREAEKPRQKPMQFLAETWNTNDFVTDLSRMNQSTKIDAPTLTSQILDRQTDQKLKNVRDDCGRWVGNQATTNTTLSMETRSFIPFPMPTIY